MPHRVCRRNAVALPALSVLLLLAGLACAKRPVDLEREAAQTLVPKRLDTAPRDPSSGPVRPLRVRVYADAEFRAQVLNWQQSIEVQLGRASAVVREPLGVEFLLDSARTWERRGAREDLEAAVAELEALDPGEDVDLVIGFLAALPVVSASQHDLGRARLFGRHCVLRGMDSPEEHQYFMEQFSRLSHDEREALYRDRKQHKQTSVLLHEWAHTLGAFHVQNSHWMMYPAYDTNQAAFAPETLKLLAVSLRHVPQGRRSREAQQAWARELQELLATTVSPDWEGPEKVAIHAWTERVLAGTEPLGPESVPPLPLADRKRLDEVLALDKQGRVEVAAQLLEPLAQHHPRDAQVQVLACYLAARAAPRLPASRERCEAAATRFPKESSPVLNLALLQLQVGNPAAAEAHLLEARKRLEAEPSIDPASWASLAGLFQNASCVTWAEQAAATAEGREGSAKVLAWASRTRRWKALPVDPARSGVPVEREGELIRAVVEVEGLLERGAHGKAQPRLAWLAREFPRAAVVQVLQCEQHLTSGRLGPARTACRKAVATHEEAIQAHLLLGMMAANTGAGAEARTHLERAIVLEPELPDAWRMLAGLYRAAGMAPALQSLQERYRTQFAQELR